MAKAYNLNKSTVLRFFQKRLKDTFGDGLVVTTSKRVAGTEIEPRFYVCVDNAKCHAMRENRESKATLPMPLSYAVTFRMDGKGGGQVRVGLYDIQYNGNKTWDNSGHNHVLWGMRKFDDNKVIPKYSRIFEIENFEVIPAAIKALNTLRKWCNPLASYTPSH